MYTRGIQVIKLVFLLLMSSITSGVSAKNLKWERGNYFSSPTVVMEMMGDENSTR